MVHVSLSWLLLTQFLIFVGDVGAKVPCIIVFGDSSIDAGNNNFIPTTARSNFKPYGRDFEGGKPTGRFCNGRITTDFISEAFGLKTAVPAYLDPAYSIRDFATGVTFGSAGTGFDNATSDVLSVIPMWKEVEYFKEFRKKLVKYLGKYKASSTLQEALYLISSGTNDFLENYYGNTRRSSQFTIEEFQNFLIGLVENFILDIYRLGARKIVLTGITAMGCVPFERTENFMGGHACREDHNKVARDFNVKLNMLIDKLRKEARGIKLVFSNVYDILLEAIEKPYLYGFENVIEGCCGTGIFEMGYFCNQLTPFTCQDANKYIFWDAIHLTEKMYHIISDYDMKTTLAIFR